MGCWVNVWNFRKTIFSRFQHFILFWEWFECYFWIPHPKINKSTNFHKNSVNQTQNMNENGLPSISKTAARRRKRRIVVQTFHHNISETIWDRILKFGTLTDLQSIYIHMLQISLKSEMGFRHVPLWCGISQKLAQCFRYILRI